MAKAKAKPPAKALAAAAAAAAASGADDAGVPMEPLKVDLYEVGALKNALDEVAREVVLDAGYEEDIMISNIKIGLGLAAIGLALYAQFGPGKFPANWWTIFWCIVTYIVLALGMNYYSWRMERDAFLVTRPFRGRQGIRLASAMGRYAEGYTLVLTDKQDPSIEVKTTIEVTSYFHSDGYHAEAPWRADVERLCAEYNALCAGSKAKDE